MDERHDGQNENRRAPAAPAASDRDKAGADKPQPPVAMPAAANLPVVEAPSLAAEPPAVASPASAPAAAETPEARAEAKSSPPARPADHPATAVPPSFLRARASRDVGQKPAPRPGTVHAPRAGAPAEPAHREKPRSRKFALLAACVAASATAGAAAGSLGATSLMLFAPTDMAPTAEAQNAAEIAALKSLAGRLAVDIGMMRANQEQSSGAALAQLDRMSERLARIEKLQADPAANINKALESLERLERRAGLAAGGNADVTGSLAAPAPPAEAKATIVEGWVLRRVYDGIALVQGRRGTLEVEAGDRLPELGRVEEIKRQDGRWVVVTSRGLIVSER